MSYKIVTCAMGLGVAGLLALGPSCKRESREPARTGDELRSPSLTPTPTSPPMPPPSAPSADERRTAELLAMLHQDNQNEIQLGKLAQERGQSKGVKQYGSMLVRDHTEADQKINDYAGRKNINLGSENEAAKKVAETGQQALEKLRGLEGNAFDREFASVMVRAHEEAVTLVKEGRQEVSDPELKTLLGKLQPVLEKHLEHAKTLQTGRAAASSEEEPAAPTQGRRPVSR